MDKKPNNHYIIGFEEISVKENLNNEVCIWCNLKRKKNLAHIFSKKIITINSAKNVLKSSVCMECNSFFGNKIEDWFYKYSPMGTWANQLKKGSDGILTNLRYVPNFLWNDDVNEWVVINHERVRDILATQLLATSTNKIHTFHFDQTGNQNVNDVLNVQQSIINQVKDGNFSEYLSEKLPVNFSPRIFEYKQKLILIARNIEDRDRLIKLIQDEDNSVGNYKIRIADESKMKEVRIHYSWSLQRYFILCAKIGFEFLSLLMDQEFCHHKRFDNFKKEIFKVKFDKITVPFVHGKGYEVNRLTPPGWIGYVMPPKDIAGFPNMTGQNQNCHSVFIYSVHGLEISLKLTTPFRFKLTTCSAGN